ncbi:hypothetical protein AVEN_111047-1 [Araneus ventricosus]|uniref:Uncharacterized protein n=1 Tax=Araneus ventricosus TaxID=182803 RepID=A0A4Y2DQ24_ARAVE|nr:hypothetical protein AVEN_111047-1 [Araneus ventricosus]
MRRKTFRNLLQIFSISNALYLYELLWFERKTTPSQREKQGGDAEKLLFKNWPPIGKTKKRFHVRGILRGWPFLSSQSLLSNPNNDITMPHTPKPNEDDIQHLLRKIERSPSTAWPTNLATMKIPKETQHNKKTKIQHYDYEFQMEIYPDLYKIKQAERTSDTCLRIEKITADEIPNLYSHPQITRTFAASMIFLDISLS